MFYFEGSYRKSQVLPFSWFNPPPPNRSITRRLSRFRRAEQEGSSAEHGLSCWRSAGPSAAVSSVGFCRVRASWRCFPPRGWGGSAAGLHQTPSQDPAHCAMSWPAAVPLSSVLTPPCWHSVPRFSVCRRIGLSLPRYRVRVSCSY